MMRGSVATVADILGREVIVPACLDRSFVPATDGKAALLKVQGFPMPSEPIKHYLSYYKPDQHQRHHNQPGKLWCRCFVGKLTDEQVVKFKNISDIDNITDFYLQGVDTLSTSSPKDKPVHQAAIRNFNEGLFHLAHCSEKYCKLTGDYTGVTKSLLEHCENCECMSICEHKSPDCGLYSNCIHPVFRSLFPAAHNFAFNSSVLDVPAFQKLDIQERIRFNRSVHRIRHIVVICELKLLTDGIRVTPHDSLNSGVLGTATALQQEKKKIPKRPGRNTDPLGDWLRNKDKEYRSIGRPKTSGDLIKEFDNLTSKERATIRNSTDGSRINDPAASKEKQKKKRDAAYSALRRGRDKAKGNQ